MTIVVTVALVVIASGLVFQSRDHVQVPSVAGHARSPEQAALGYLTALAEGNSSDVLKYMTVVPQSQIFITDDVLAQSRSINLIKNVTVNTGWSSDDTARVHVSFQFGQLQIKDVYEVARCPDGFWRVGLPFGHESSVNKNGYIDILFLDGVGDRNLTVNGVPVPPGSTSLTLLPGTNRIGNATPLFTVSPDVLVLPSLMNSAIYNPEVLLTQYAPEVALTAEAERRLVSVLQTTLQNCLHESVSVTSCGLAFDTGAHNQNVRWSSEPGSADISTLSYSELYWGEAQLSTCLQKSGVWAVWLYHPTRIDKSTVRVRGTTTLPAAQVSTRLYSLQQYLVDVSDPDNLLVYFYWERADAPPGADPIVRDPTASC
ncbi:MAG: hypothetical protein FWE61_06255 [Micrococcales bacterium]|nr:hypothetical protein [Micrococcales bacterium]